MCPVGRKLRRGRPDVRVARRRRGARVLKAREIQTRHVATLQVIEALRTVGCREFGARGGRRGGRALGAAPLDEHLFQCLAPDRFGKIVVHSRARAFFPVAFYRGRRHRDDWNISCVSLEREMMAQAVGWKFST